MNFRSCLLNLTRGDPIRIENNRTQTRYCSKYPVEKYCGKSVHGFLFDNNCKSLTKLPDCAQIHSACSFYYIDGSRQLILETSIITAFCSSIEPASSHAAGLRKEKDLISISGMEGSLNHDKMLIGWWKWNTIRNFRTGIDWSSISRIPGKIMIGMLRQIWHRWILKVFFTMRHIDSGSYTKRCRLW